MFSLEAEQQESIARTGFYVSLISYILFWMLDLWRPGFVARFFSVHIFLLGIIVFGVWWGSVVQEYADSPRIQLMIALVCGILIAVLTWNLGAAFGAWRLLVCLIALLAPVVIHRLLRYK